MIISYFKNYRIALCVVLLIGMSSCSKDEDTQDDTLENILEENVPESITETPETTNVPEEEAPETTPNTNEDIIDSSNLNAVEQDILELVNAHRQSIGKQPLAISFLANTLADEHTEYMISIRDINHNNFDARSNRLVQEENARRTGENVAFGQRSAQAVMTAWLNSDGHRRNIEGDFTHIGVSAINNNSGVPYYTQLFLKK